MNKKILEFPGPQGSRRRKLSDEKARQNRAIPLRPELVELTGDIIAALILQQLCYWTGRTDVRGRWISKSAATLIGELGGGASARTVQRKLAAMEKDGLIVSRLNKKAPDGSRDYQVNLDISDIARAVSASGGRTDANLLSDPRDNLSDPRDNLSDPRDNLSDPRDNLSDPRDNLSRNKRVFKTTTTTSTREASPISPEQSEPTAPQKPKAENPEPPKPDPADIDIDRFIHRELSDHGLEPRIGESQQIARRLILSELSEADRRRYLVDDVSRLREKVDSGAIDRRRAIDWIGSTKGISWWLSSVKTARAAAPTQTQSGAVASKTRLITPVSPDALKPNEADSASWYDPIKGVWHVGGEDGE